MSTRKKHSLRLRIERSARSLLKTNHVAVVNVEPGDTQIMLNWKTCKQIRSRPVADALCDIAHAWTIYISVFCQAPGAGQYSKSIEFSPAGLHLVANLEQLMVEKHAELVAQANKMHVIGSGWLAIPDTLSLTEAEADRVFTAMGVWKQAAAA